MKRVVFVLFTSMLFFTSCVFSISGIKGDGNVVSQERAASGFYGLAINGAANVNVHHGEDYKVVVTTDNNLHPTCRPFAYNSLIFISI